MPKKPRFLRKYLLIQSSWPFGSDIIYGEKLGDVLKKYKTDDSVMFKVKDGEIVRINKSGGER